MKIALLTPTYYPYSGIDRVVELDTKEYEKQGHEVTIYTLAGEQKNNVKIIGMPKNQSLERIYRLLFFLDIMKIKKYAKELQKYDKIVSYFYPMNLIAKKAKKKYGKKWTYWNAGIAYPKLFRSFTERTYMKIFKYLVKKSLSNVDDAVSISKFIAGELKKETGVESTVKYIEIDKERFHPGIDESNIREKWGITDEKVFLYVGRISPHKGIHLLIKAFNQMLKEKPNSRLLIVGKQTFGNYAKELKKISNEKIIFTGFVNDKELPLYYSTCDVYVTASQWEGYDMPIVEAQACGKPTISYELASHPEVVKNGIMVKTTQEFAQAMVKI